MSEVSIQEVRDYLNKLEVEQVPDETIVAAIRLAGTIVDNEKSSQAGSNLVKQAKLVLASYYTYIAYATEFERGVGTLPATVIPHMSMLKEQADRLLGYVKRGAADIQFPMGLTTSNYESESDAC